MKLPVIFKKYFVFIACYSIVFLVALPFLATHGSTGTAGPVPFSIFLIGGAFLIVQTVTMFALARTFGNTFFQYQKDMANETDEKNALRKSLEKDIEERTFELQRIVGALNREIGERTQAEEELKRLEKQQSLILDSAGEGILGIDSDGLVIFMNTAAEVMLGWEKEELHGKSHHEYIHHSHSDGNAHPVEDCPIYMAYRDGQIHYKTGDVFWAKNGTSFPVEYVSTPIRDRGLLTGAVVVFRDMTTFA